jgi:hypothetical protein
MNNVRSGQVLELHRSVPRGLDRLPHRGRPSDRLERWPVSAASRDLLHDAAEQLGIAAGTAGCLLAEHGLLLHEISHDAAGWLDTCAARVVVHDALDNASALYLRSLSVPVGPAAVPDEEVVKLPARLTNLLTAYGGPELFLSGDLDQARRWEQAAVINTMTMTEWAYSALRAGAALDA